jgi:hypothetical protein
MRVGSVLPNIANKVASSYKKSGSIINKAGNFIDPNGKAVSAGVLSVIMLTAVPLPRFFKSRNSTERREVLIRDFPTVTTLLFAMKAMKGGIAKAAEKKMGLVLTNGPKDYRSLPLGKKLKNLFSPNSGVTVFNTDEILQKYTRINDSETLAKMLTSVQEQGGDIKKLLTIDSKKGKVGELSAAVSGVFGDKFKDMKPEEIIAGIKNPANSDKVKGIIDVLDDADKNPIVKNSKVVTAGIKYLSWGVVVFLLGYGLSKLNQIITNAVDGKKKAKNADGDTLELSGSKISDMEKEIFADVVKAG